MLMLPRRLYEIVPYLYIITGIVSALLIHSRLIIISSMLMVMAGVLILSMRISSRRRHGHSRLQLEGGFIGGHSRPYIERSAHNRRRFAATRFPIIDASGKPVEFERREGERRLLSA
jgi:hypothetical protein